MTEAAQFAALRTWLIAVTGLPEIIHGHPGGHRPSGVYATLRRIRSAPVNWPEDYDYEARDLDTGEDAEPFDQVPVETWAWTWSLNLYGAGAADLAARITSASRTDGALVALDPLTIAATSAVRDLPELIGERWEPRSQMDITVHGDVRHGFAVDVIGDVTVDFTTGIDEDVGSASATHPDD